MRGGFRQRRKRQKNQLFGIEYQPEIYPLAVSNMLLHGDGKSNIISGNCFDEQITKIIKNKNPTVGFLNPPYKSEPDDIEEFEFILNSLECLEKHGQCVAIVPMGCALAKSGERLRLKKQLLSKHTLEAVFSMPDELFYNSKVGTNTCIMIFEAHIKHPERKKTFFGYFKDDSFYKKRTKGRYDYDKRWLKTKDDWLDLYFNNEEKSELSKSVKIVAESEWCAEQHMLMDYTKLKDNAFQQLTLNYLSYYVSQGDFEVIARFLNDGERERKGLNVNNWADFDIGSLFNVTLGRPIHRNSIKKNSQRNKSGYLPYVTRTAKNNGIEMYVDNKVLGNQCYIQNGKCITIGAEGFKAFYQKDSFATGNKVNILRNESLTLETSLFLNCILNFEIEKKFGYGRGLVKFRIEELSIKLPTKNKQPDWQFMENYIKSLPYSSNL